MAQSSKSQWRGFAPTLCWRRSALNILQNHLEEALALNKKLPRFQLGSGEKLELLPVEDFLLRLCQAKLPFTRAAVEHFRLIAGQWPVGTVCWEDLPSEKNPYLKENSRFQEFKAPSFQEIVGKELLRDNRDLLFSAVAQGRKAAKLGLAESDCELQDELLKEAWKLGFQKELEKQKGAISDEKAL